MWHIHWTCDVQASLNTLWHLNIDIYDAYMSRCFQWCLNSTYSVKISHIQWICPSLTIILWHLNIIFCMPSKYHIVKSTNHTWIYHGTSITRMLYIIFRSPLPKLMKRNARQMSHELYSQNITNSVIWISQNTLICIAQLRLHYKYPSDVSRTLSSTCHTLSHLNTTNRLDLHSPDMPSS